MQTGIRKPVNIIIDKDKPSTPKFILKLGKASHEISWTTWNCVFVVSKITSKQRDKLKTSNDQKSEKFLIKSWLYFSVKNIIKAPITGESVKRNSI